MCRRQLARVQTDPATGGERGEGAPFTAQSVAGTGSRCGVLQGAGKREGWAGRRGGGKGGSNRVGMVGRGDVCEVLSMCNIKKMCREAKQIKIKTEK